MNEEKMEKDLNSRIRKLKRDYELCKISKKNTPSKKGKNILSGRMIQINDELLFLNSIIELNPFSTMQIVIDSYLNEEEIKIKNIIEKEMMLSKDIDALWVRIHLYSVKNYTLGRSGDCIWVYNLISNTRLFIVRKK